MDRAVQGREEVLVGAEEGAVLGWFGAVEECLTLVDLEKCNKISLGSKSSNSRLAA